jgi:hypothetical protein
MRRKRLLQTDIGLHQKKMMTGHGEEILAQAAAVPGL